MKAGQELLAPLHVEARKALRPSPSSASRARRSAAHELASGRRVQVDPAASLVQISSPSGQIELTLRCTENGCVLSFANAHLALAAPGRIDVRCAEFNLDARQHLELASGGDCRMRVAGDARTSIGGQLDTRADELRLCSTGGDALIEANDYVRLAGEKILLNSEHERAPGRDQIEAFWRHLGL